jgi:chitinase
VENTTPLQALDGNFYFPGTADYDAAMMDLLLSGFAVAGNVFNFFPGTAP